MIEKNNGSFCYDKNELKIQFSAYNKNFHALLDRMYDLASGVQLDAGKVKFTLIIEGDDDK